MNAASAADELCCMPLLDAAAMLRNRCISARELVEAQLDRLGRLDPELCCYSEVFAAEALTQADVVDRKPGNGLLRGIPVSIKDNLDVAGHATTAGSPVFEGRIAREDATAVARLRAEGAIVLGKTVLYEFAFGAANDRWPASRNPHDPTRSTGGSSSGSAAAVAACLCFGSVGTDTGGSIRVPAALCGVVGVKPTFGGIPTDGLVPLSRLDHIGPIARTIGDAALLLQALGVCSGDAPAIADVRGLRVGVVEPDPGLDEDIAVALDGAAGLLRGGGASISQVRLDRKAARRALWVIASSDAAANLLELVRDHPDVHPLVRSRIHAGAKVSSSDVAEALGTQRQLTAEVAAIFREVDVLLLPVAPFVSYGLGQRFVRTEVGDEDVSAAATTYTPTFNLTGAPALSLPFRRSSRGLPVALQLAAPWRSEATLLGVGRLLEEGSEWFADTDAVPPAVVPRSS